MKMHTKIKSSQEASKRGRFCNYFFKIAIILYLYIKPSQCIMEVRHGQLTTLCHRFVKKLPYTCRINSREKKKKKSRLLLSVLLEFLQLINKLLVV